MNECSPTFWKTENADGIIHRPEKYFSFKKGLNNFAMIELRFLRTITGILSKPVAFVESRILIGMETFRAEIGKSQRLCSVKREAKGRL